MYAEVGILIQFNSMQSYIQVEVRAYILYIQLVLKQFHSLPLHLKSKANDKL